MSATINLRELHQRVVCVQAECALWQLRHEAERLLATTTDEARRVRLAEVMRDSVGRCPPDRVIRGYHGRFAGCMDGGGSSGHMPEGGIHMRGGIKHEIDLDVLRGEGRDKFLSKYANLPHEVGQRMFSARIGELSLKAEQAARNLSDEDITALKNPPG